MPAPSTHTDFDPVRQLEIARRAVARRSFCVLATSSARNRPHAVGVMYTAVDLTLYVLVGENTVKVRNIRENPHVAVSVPVRKYPMGPPMAVQFQGLAEVLTTDDPRIARLREAGTLRRVTSLSGAEAAGTCFLAVAPHRRVSTYGLGIPLRRLLRDVSQGHRSVDLTQVRPG